MTKDDFKDKKSYYEKSIDDVKKALKTTEENYAKETKKIEARLDGVSKDLADKIKEVVRITAEIDGIKVELETLNTDKVTLTGKNAMLDTQLGLKWKDYNTKVDLLKKDTEDLDTKKRAFLKMMSEKHAELDAKRSGIEYAEGKNKGVLGAIVAEKEGIKTLIKKHDEEKLDFAEKQHQHAFKVKEHSDKMQKDNSLISRLDTWEKGLVNKDKAGKSKSDALDSREKAISATEQAQKDKGVEQDLREVEQDKKERRLNNLAELHKDKK